MVKKYFIKIISLSIVILMLFGMSVGCKQTEDTVSTDIANNISSQEKVYSKNTNVKKTKPKKLDVDSRDSFLGINGKHLYYITLANYELELSDAYIMRYNLQTDKKTKIGEIKNLSTLSNVNAFVDSRKLFATFGVVEEENIVNIHTEIDLKSGGVTILSKDTNFPPLVQNIPINKDCFLEYQPQKLGDDSYRYVLRVIDAKNGDAKDIVVKERKAGGTGKMIVDACVYDSVIYTYEYDRDEKNSYVCSYDLNGNQITKEKIEFLDEFITAYGSVGEIEVINEYYFFESMVGKRLVLHRSDAGWNKREDLVMDKTGFISNLIENFNFKNKNYKKALLYDYNNKQLSYLDTDTGEKIDLDIELPGATYCITDGKQIVYLDDNKEVYYVEDVFAK